MYESHFDFTGPPFSLNADPSFFFGSRGHSNALSYLKFGVYQGEGFVVLTGEIGAGKTTLVRTLLAELDHERIVAAQIVSTQLEAGDLLRSIALAFGVAPKSLSKAELIATIEAFLTQLAMENRRALLIVDEAQNLERGAVEELRMLSNFQLGNQALLQSFLVGQPELRVLLTSKPMEQFRQRVIASCHLGPMEKAETRAYIEHRLRQVGWKGVPSFDDEAFERIFHRTSGIPRRVNVLCNRLLLAAYLASETRLDAGTVDKIGEEMRGEIGEALAHHAPSSFSEGLAPVVIRPLDVSPGTPIPAPLAARTTVTARSAGPLVFVAAGALDDIKIALVLRAWKRHAAVGRPIRVRIGDASRFALDDPFCAQLGVNAPLVLLGVRAAPASARIGEVMKRFALVIDENGPSAIVVVGNDDAALACSLVASKKGCRIVHLEAGLRAEATSDAANGVLIDRLADVCYPSEATAFQNLVREGVNDENVQDAGSLLMDALQVVAADARASQLLVRHGGSATITRVHDRSYGLVALDESFSRGDSDGLVDLLSRLDETSRESRLIWPLGPAFGARLGTHALRKLAANESIDIVEPLGFVDNVALLKGAAFVVTNSPDVQLQAAVVQVRCLWMEPHHAPAPASKSEPPNRPGGCAAQRIADHLANWIAEHAGSA